MCFQVQVWAGGVAAIADQADDLPGDDIVADFDRWAAQHVAVPRDGPVEVQDLGIPTFSAPDLAACDP
ncbi:hypothetical protein GCM10009661_75050 [Catellatospora chokoriensis]